MVEMLENEMVENLVASSGDSWVGRSVAPMVEKGLGEMDER